MIQCKIDFNTSYNQFYISSDNGNLALRQGTGNWSKESYNSRLGVYENMLAIYTESYGHIKGELFLLCKENKDSDFSSYDHIVEGSLNVKSGFIQFLDCPNSQVELEMQVTPGKYRVRVFFSNLLGYDSDDEESDDFYIIEIWPNSHSEKKILKLFPREFPAL